MDAIIHTKTGSTKSRWERAAKSKSFDTIRNRNVAETKSDEFLAVLAAGKVSTNVFLRRLHNFAAEMNWLLAPIIPKKIWPKVKYKEATSISYIEHQRIIERENNPQRKAYYQLCWYIGGSQTDMALLKAENIDWEKRR